MFTRRKSVTMIVGEPCTGKSTIVRELVRDATFHDVKWTPHYVMRDGITCVIGKSYEDATQQFPGTDRLSQAVQPHALAFIASTVFRHYVVEGARLGNGKFLAACLAAGYSVRLAKTYAHPRVLEARRKQERVQTERFLKATKTQVANLVASADVLLDRVVTIPCNTTDDIRRAVGWITEPFKPIKIRGS
jgi:hypothetical protein